MAAILELKTNFQIELITYIRIKLLPMRKILLCFASLGMIALGLSVKEAEVKPKRSAVNYYDVTGKRVEDTTRMANGIYFREAENELTTKIIK